MKRTWGETWQRCMDLGAVKTTKYTKYRNEMIRACNEAMNYVVEHGRPIVSKYVLSQRNIPTIYSNEDIVSYYGSNIVYTYDGVKSIYFECDGNGIATIVSDIGTQTITLESDGGFKSYRATAEGVTTLTFSGSYAYNVRNVAFYGILTGSSLSDVPAYSKYIPYDLKELTKSNEKVLFMDFYSDKPVRKAGKDDSYAYVVDYKKEQGHIILLNRDEVGEFDIWYKKYPIPIDTDTLDTYELELDGIAADIIPYRMAFNLWADDDLSKAVIWNNTADDMLTKLKEETNLDASPSSYKNSSGWW